MRELLFRGKCIKYNEWHYGGITKHRNSYFIIGSSSGFSMSRETALVIPVHPKTVGQCVGTLDKDGKSIFEGDILEIVLESGDINDYEVRRYKLLWNNIVWNFIGEFNYFEARGAHEKRCMFALDEMKVIGNIYDNPELLITKEEKE
jgi:uncharacterized phage protein (TIGR01671 family)